MGDARFVLPQMRTLLSPKLEDVLSGCETPEMMPNKRDATDRPSADTLIIKPVTQSSAVYIRFVLTEVHEDSNRRSGILVAANKLKDEGSLPAYDQHALTSLCVWFNEHLRVPRILREDEHYRALSWFKSEAARPIRQMWLLVHLLRNYGFIVDVLKTDFPGTVIYEDKWQIVAKPPRGKKLGW